MKIKKIVIICVVSLVILFSIIFGMNFFKKQFIESGFGDSLNSANQHAQDVTMVQLIATPEKYDGEFVRVIGVGNLEFEGNCLSLSKDDLKYHTGNSIWIELGSKAISYEEAKQYNGEYVIVEGYFDKDDCGHMNLFCGSIKNISRYELQDTHLIYHSMITQEIDKTYSYEINDYNGQTLFSQKNLTKQPKREYVSTDIVGISIQAGTGLSTKQTTYFDLENSRVSEVFTYALTAKGNYVVYASYESEQHNIIVQNIFDKSAYYKTYTLENISPVAADFVTDCKISNDYVATITYVSGEDYTETEITIKIP